MFDTHTTDMSDETQIDTNNLTTKELKKAPTNLVKTPVKRYIKGMGQAVADRTINRKVIHKLRHPEVLIIKLQYHENTSLNDEVEMYCRDKGYIISHHETLEQDKDLSKTLKIALHIVAKQEMEH